MADNETERVGALLPVVLMAKVRRAKEQLSASSGGARVTVTHALTFLIGLGLADFDRMNPPRPGDPKAPRPRPMAKARKR